MPESLVAREQLSKPWREKRHHADFAVLGLVLDHGSDIIWFLEIVPSGRQESRRNLAQHERNIVQDDEKNDTSNDTVGNIV